MEFNPNLFYTQLATVDSATTKFSIHKIFLLPHEVVSGDQGRVSDAPVLLGAVDQRPHLPHVARLRPQLLLQLAPVNGAAHHAAAEGDGAGGGGQTRHQAHPGVAGGGRKSRVNNLIKLLKKN